MRAGLVVVVFLASAPAVRAGTVCLFGTCGEVGTMTKTPDPPSRNNDHDNDRGGGGGGSREPVHREPPPVDQWSPPSQYERAAATAADLVNDAYEALQAGKYDKAITAYQRAADVYGKIGARGPRVSALRGLAIAEHDKGLLLLKKAAKDLKGVKARNEARLLFAAAVRDNPDEPQFEQDRADADRVTPGWCKLNRPLMPQPNTMTNEWGIVDSAETICQKKAIMGKALECEWAATFEAERCIVSF